MSATTLDPAPQAAAAPRTRVYPVTLRRVLISEWIKLRSLRSTTITLAVAFVLMIGTGILIAALTNAQWSTMSASSKASFDPVDTALQGHFIAQLAIGVLGVLVISGEYATGMIRATLTAVPKRLPVLWAKSTVFGAVALVTMTLASFIAFFATQAVLTTHQLQTTISQPGVLRAVIGSGLYLTVIALLSVAIGTLLRNTAAAITTVVGLLMLLPALIDLLPSSISQHILPYLPSRAGSALTWVHQQPGYLSPWAGFAVLCGYAVVAMAGAAYVLKRRDA
jgi:ABC-type transport system involved in multi-copper enzyme maturation permease subunit